MRDAPARVARAVPRPAEGPGSATLWTVAEALSGGWAAVCSSRRLCSCDQVAKLVLESIAAGGSLQASQHLS